MKKSLYYRISFLILAAAAFSALAPVKPLSVTEFRRLAPKSGFFSVSGYVSYIYKCPPCPPPAMCKPCMPDNLVLSENYSPDLPYPNSGEHLVIKTDEPDNVKVGLRYWMTVKVEPTNSMNYGLNDLSLISSGPVDGE